MIDVMKKISEGSDIHSTFLLAPKFDWALWKNIDTARPILSGHSLGGSAALAVSADDLHPYRAVIVMDPAVQRKKIPAGRRHNINSR